MSSSSSTPSVQSTTTTTTTGNTTITTTTTTTTDTTTNTTTSTTTASVTVTAPSGRTTLQASDLSDYPVHAGVVFLTLVGFNTIPDKFFANMSVNTPASSSLPRYINLQSITFAGTKGILSIGKGAFYRSNITTVSFPNESIITIGEGAFCYCIYLIQIDLSHAISIGRFAFYYTTNLIEVDLTGLSVSSLDTLGNGAFYNCNQLVRVIMSPYFLSKAQGKPPPTNYHNLLFEVDPTDFDYYDTTTYVYEYGSTETVPDLYTISFGFKCDRVPPNTDLLSYAGLDFPTTNLDTVGNYYWYYMCYKCSLYLGGRGAPGNGFSVAQLANSTSNVSGDFDTWNWHGSSWCPQPWVLGLWVNKFRNFQVQSWREQYPAADFLANATNFGLDILQNGRYQFQFPYTYSGESNSTTADASDIKAALESYNYSDIFYGNIKLAGGVSVQTSGNLSLTFGSKITSLTGNFADVPVTKVLIPAQADLSKFNFTNCTTLEEVYFPYDFQYDTIPESFFSGCTSLTYITLPKSVTTIAPKAFYGCSKLVGSAESNILNLGNITKIGNEPPSGNPTTTQLQDAGQSFSNCVALSEFVLSPNLVLIAPYSFSGCSSLQLFEDTFTFADGSNSSLTQLYPNTFENCSSITMVSLPPIITTIGSSCFKGCSGLENIFLSTGLETIGDYAFSASYINGEYQVASLDYVNLPPSVTSIGYLAFNRTKISVMSISINYISQNSTLLTEQSTYTDPNTRGGYSDFMYNIFGPPFDGSTEVETDTTFQYIPKGVKLEYYYTFGKKPNSSYNTSTLTSEDVVYWMNEWKLSRIFTVGPFNAFIDPSITSIGDAAFSNCDNLTTMSIHINVTSIGRQAFMYCTQLTQLFFGTNLEALNLCKLESIGDYAFAGSNMSQVIIPPSVKSIGRWCFYNSLSLSDIVFFRGSQISTIEDYCFANCVEMSSFKFPTNVTVIGDASFRNCLNLERLTLPPTLTSIGEEAFQSCVRISYVNIPDSLNYIGKNAFKNTSLSVTPEAGQPPAGLAIVPYHDKDISAPLNGEANSLMSSISSNTLQNCSDGTYNNVVLDSEGSGSGARATVIVSGGIVVSVTVTTPGINYSNEDVLQIAAGTLGANSTARVFTLQKENIASDMITPSTVDEYFNADSTSDTTKEALITNYEDDVFSYDYYIWLRYAMTEIAESDLGNYHLLKDILPMYEQNASKEDIKTYLSRAQLQLGGNSQAVPTAKSYVEVDDSGSSTANQNINNSYFRLKNSKMLLEADPPIISPIPDSQVRYKFTFKAKEGSNGVLTRQDVLSVIPTSLQSMVLASDGTYVGFYVSFDDNVLSIGTANNSSSVLQSYTGVFQQLPVYGVTHFNNVQVIGDKSFYQCITLNQSISFPPSVETIGISAFEGSSLYGLNFLTIFNTVPTLLGLNTILDSAFKNTQLANACINFPKTLTTIGSDAFSELYSPFSSLDTTCTCRLYYDVSQHTTLATNYTDYVSIGLGSNVGTPLTYSNFILFTNTVISSSSVGIVDINTYEITAATLSGGYIPSTSAQSIFRKVGGIVGSYIVSAVEGGYCKMVEVQLSIVSGMINAKVVGAAYVDAFGSDVTNSTWVNGSYSKPKGTEPVATSATMNGYGVNYLEINKVKYSWLKDDSIKKRYSASMEPPDLNESNANAVVAVGTGTSSIYYSSDGGVQWTGIPYSNDPFVNGQANCVASDGHKFYAGGYGFIQPGNGNGENPPDSNDPPSIIPQLAVSVDFGKTWFPIYNASTTASSPFGKVSTAPTSNNENGQNGGPPPPLNYGLINGIAFSESNDVWIAGGSNGNNEATLGYSTNGGSTMNGADISSFNLSAVNSIACGNGIVVAVCTGGSGQNNIIYSESSSGKVLGQEWNTSSTNIFGSSNLYSIVFNGTRWVASAMDSKIFWSDDGKAWSKGTFAVSGQPAPATPWYTLGSLLQANSSMTQDINIMSVSWNGTEFLAKAGYFGMGGSATTVTDVTSLDGKAWTLPDNVQAWEDTTQNQAFLDTIWTGTNWISVGFNTLPVYSTTNTNQSGVTWNTGTLKSSDSDSDSDNESVVSNSGNYYQLFGVATVHVLPYTQGTFAISNGIITRDLVLQLLPESFDEPVALSIRPRVYDSVVANKSTKSMPIVIDDFAFAFTPVSSVFLDNVTIIGESAFLACPYLETVIFNTTTKFIGFGAFMQTPLTYCSLPVSASTYFNASTFTGIAKVSFYCTFTKPSDGILTQFDVETQLGFLGQNYYGKITATFDSTVNIIGSSAFHGNKYISQVILAPTIEIISENAFKSCTYLTTVVPSVPNGSSLVYIGKNAFNSCSELKSVSLPSSVYDIEQGAFLSCDKLWTVNLPIRFFYGVFVMYNLYFESNMMTGESWKSDAQWSATGTFFTFNFQENGQTVQTYSWAKQHYMATQRAQQATKVAEHDAYENSAHSPLHILEDVGLLVACVAVPMALGGVAGYLGIGVSAAVKAGEGVSALGVTADSIVAPAEDATRGLSDATMGTSADGGDGLDEIPTQTSGQDGIYTSQGTLAFKDTPGLMTVRTAKRLFLSQKGDLEEALEDGTVTLEDIENLNTNKLVKGNIVDGRAIFSDYRSYNFPAQITNVDDNLFWKRIEQKYGTSFITPDDLERELKIELRGNPLYDTWSNIIVTKMRDLGWITQDGAKLFYTDISNRERYNLINEVVASRNARIEEEIAEANAQAEKYKAEQQLIQDAQDAEQNAASAAARAQYRAEVVTEFARRCFDGMIAASLVVPLWNRFVDRTLQYPAEQVVSTTAISNLITLRNEYGNMSTIYRVKSATPIPASYTSHTPGSWILTTSVSYPMYLQVNLQALYDVYETTMINIIGEQLYRASKLTKSQSHTSKGYTSHSLTLTIYRDYENVTSQEKANITNIIDTNLRQELQKYVPEGDSNQNEDVTTTTTTTPPNNPAVYPQLLGGGPSAGYSPKLVLLSEGGSDRAQSRFMLRTGWNNALDSRNTTSFASVNNTGNKNFVRDSSNFIKYRKLRAINQNYNDLKK